LSALWAVGFWYFFTRDGRLYTRSNAGSKRQFFLFEGIKTTILSSARYLPDPTGANDNNFSKFLKNPILILMGFITILLHPNLMLSFITILLHD
jgi:hypothetical protein